MLPTFEPKTPFEVYTFMKLEAMTERLNALPCDEQNKRLGKCENNISNITGNATIIGAIAGGVSAWFIKYVLGR